MDDSESKWFTHLPRRGAYPRTEKVILHGMEVYRAARGTGSGSETDSTHHATAQFALDGVAGRVVEAFEKLLSTPPRLPARLQGPVREWLSLMPNFIMESEEALDLIQKFSKSPSSDLTETESSKHEH